MPLLDGIFKPEVKQFLCSRMAQLSNAAIADVKFFRYLVVIQTFCMKFYDLSFSKS